jgi:hypothetical protein
MYASTFASRMVSEVQLERTSTGRLRGRVEEGPFAQLPIRSSSTWQSMVTSKRDPVPRSDLS